MPPGDAVGVADAERPGAAGAWREAAASTSASTSASYWLTSRRSCSENSAHRGPESVPSGSVSPARYSAQARTQSATTVGVTGVTRVTGGTADIPGEPPADDGGTESGIESFAPRAPNQRLRIIAVVLQASTAPLPPHLRVRRAAKRYATRTTLRLTYRSARIALESPIGPPGSACADRVARARILQWESDGVAGRESPRRYAGDHAELER